jgi:DNA-binding NarL/FixJ family response regulator|tara:strand:- start:268 stop:567 length:300 start_codon:yes stop_codon:yes gene_type:complete
VPLAQERANVFWVKELSGRERQVSVLVARELTNEQIGETLHISELTVKTHLRNIYSKTDVHDRGQLISLILKSEADFWNVEYHKLMRRLHQAQDDKNKT